jgi:peptidoglycan pentaglycine glycine transferase (the first glycine)
MISPSATLQMRLLADRDRLDWDALVRANPGSCFMQAWAWADFKEKEGYHTFRYGLFQQDCLVGGCIFYSYRSNTQANLLIATGGPYLPIGQEAQAFAQVLNTAQTLAQQVGAIALRLEPLWDKKPEYLQGFVRAPADLLPSETLWIDLRPAESAILAAMKPKGRYNIRVSQRQGVTVDFTTDLSAIPIFYDVFWETVERQQFFGEPYGFFINLCQTLLSAGMAEIGLAQRKGEVLAVMLLVYWGDKATYLYGGRTARYPEAMASYGLHWAALKRAKAKGCHFYDFYGYSCDSNHSYAQFSKFKRQFGGQVISTLGAHDYFFYNRLADTLIKVLNRLHPGGERAHD